MVYPSLVFLYQLLVQNSIHYVKKPSPRHFHKQVEGIALFKLKITELGLTMIPSLNENIHTPICAKPLPKPCITIREIMKNDTQH